MDNLEPENGSAADAGQEVTVRDNRRVVFALLAYGTAFAMLIFASPPVQRLFGIYGLIISEALMLAIALIGASVTRQNLRDVFPIAIPAGREAGGTLMVWLGIWGISIYATLIILTFFPQYLDSMNSGMEGLAYSQPFPVVYFVVAVMPAVCEEALFRGFIQHNNRKIGKWLWVIIIGFLFGLMHMDPVRLLPLSVLGIGLCYLMMKTNNLALPMLFHLINNSLSVLSLFYLQRFADNISTEIVQTVDASQALSELLSGGWAALLLPLVYVWFSPFLILGGSILLEPQRPYGPGRFRDKKAQVIVAAVFSILSVAGFVLGIILSAQGILDLS